MQLHAPLHINILYHIANNLDTNKATCGFLQHSLSVTQVCLTLKSHSVMAYSAWPKQTMQATLLHWAHFLKRIPKLCKHLR